MAYRGGGRRAWAETPCSGHLLWQRGAAEICSLRRTEEGNEKGLADEGRGGVWGLGYTGCYPGALHCQDNSVLVLRTNPMLLRGRELKQHLLKRERARGFVGGRGACSRGTLSGRRERWKNTYSSLLPSLSHYCCIL